MTRAQVMQWLLTLGKDWVGIGGLYELFRPTFDDAESLWDVLGEWHDGAWVTKRHNTYIFEKRTYSTDIIGIEQYKLTKKALTLLGERTEDE